MSRPAADVRRVIKAYDVRGLVGEEIDAAFVTDVGAAFARLVRTDDPPEITGDAGLLTSMTGWAPTIPLERTLGDILAELEAAGW